MATVAILGAGDMGTALATPLARNGHDARLWGTELDAAVVATLRAGAPHPRLGTVLPPGVEIFAGDGAVAALAGAEIVVVAVTSVAVRAIVGRLATLIATPRTVVSVAKGFDPGANGDRSLLLPDVIGEGWRTPVVAVGGPSKANEVARGLPTQVVFGGRDEAATRLCAETFATQTYRVETTDDVVGLEVAAAMKNAYAIALGIADGLERATGQPHHNLRAALFPRAVAEMAVLAEACGGRAETVRGLAGAGDLQVTITAGRNRLLGDRIGGGEPAAAAAAALEAAGTTVEGYLATGFGYRLATETAGSAAERDRRYPLLMALWRVLYEAAPPLPAIWGAAGGAGWVS